MNPLNGEGIDYGLETGRLVAETDRRRRGPGDGVAGAAAPSTTARRSRSPAGWPAWSPCPRLLPTLGPAGMRSDWLMTLALRWMGNLVTDEDRDRAARVWRWAGRRSLARDHRPPFS